MSHPPIEHNPHVWADMGVTLNADGNPVTHSVQEPVAAQDDVATGADGGEPPSANPAETAESAGTGSSPSSSPAATSNSSTGKQTPSPAPSAVNPSAPAAKTDSSTAPGATGTGTGL